MRKLSILLIFIFLSTVSLSAQSVGTGFTFFIPDSLLAGEDGSLTMETGFETSLGLGGPLSIPFGFTYIKTDGLMAGGTTTEYDYSNAMRSWYMSDVMLLHAMLQVRIDLGPVFAQAYGGIAGSWLMTLSPYADNMEAFYLSASTNATVAETHLGSISQDHRFGFGWQAGGGIGVRFGDIEVQVDATYRRIQHSGTLSAELISLDSDGNPAVAPTTLTEQVNLLLRGLSVGIGGSFSF